MSDESDPGSGRKVAVPWEISDPYLAVMLLLQILEGKLLS